MHKTFNMKTFILILSVVLLYSCEKEIIEVEKKEIIESVVYHNVNYTLPNGSLVTKSFILAENAEYTIKFEKVMRGKQLLKVWDDNKQVVFDTVYSNQSKIVHYKNKKLSIR